MPQERLIASLQIAFQYHRIPKRNTNRFLTTYY